MKTSILRNKYYLYLTEFFAGISVMAVELGASRLLAPYFSSSQIVWTIIIGTIMIAMALGNIYGGRSADKDPSPDRLYGRLLVASVWIAAIPFLGRFVILGISAVVIFSVSEMYLIWAALFACLIVFVYPLFLLGTVTPSLVKYTVDSLEDNGSTVGKLNACNTIGSIIGTFLPTFVTIPTVGTAATFIIFSGILLLLAVVYFVSVRRGMMGVIISVSLYIFASIFGIGSRFAFWEDDLTYEGESIYNYLQVSENDDIVVLSTNVLFGVQSVYVKDPELNRTGYYYDYAMAAPIFAGAEPKATRISQASAEKQKSNSKTTDILVLGMGCGTYATQLDRIFDNVTVRGVEIDEKITNLSREYFELSDDIVVTTYDGRAYLNAVDDKYDVIMVDAYQDITIPFQMSSREFFALVAAHLKDNGVMVVNLNMRSDEDGNINEYLCDTIASVFSEVYTVDVYRNTNRELFAAKRGGIISRDSYEGEVFNAILPEDFWNKIIPYEGGDYIFTDDRAPVELLGMRVIDSLIADEVAYYRDIYDSEGVEGLLGVLL